MWRDEATLLDIAQAARRIVSFVRGVDEVSFAANAEAVPQLLKQIEPLLPTEEP
jgi:uncharacterized protein with HEPN domain